MHLRDACTRRTERREHIRPPRPRVVNDNGTRVDNACRCKRQRYAFELAIADREQNEPSVDVSSRNALSRRTNAHAKAGFAEGSPERKPDFAGPENEDIHA
jgi:hypothetical protein